MNTMFQSFKYQIFNLFATLTKKRCLCFGLLLFVFCLLPLYFAFAGPFDFLNPAVWIGQIVKFIFTLCLYVAKGFLWLGYTILSWAIGNPWKVSYTDPANNDIIKIGWVLLRDFTNMFFILGLAYIGLATSLDLSGFKTKEVFIKILQIALIINFTPIICGVIVDITNIISRFFLIGIDFSAIGKAYDNQMGVIWYNLDNIIADWKVAIQAIALFVYGIITALVLLIFALIFFVRGPVIWILVILSPLAFFFWVFPTTSKWWSMWWGKFLGISFIAIPGAFFLYLSQQVMVNSANLVDASGLDSGFFASLAPYFAVLIFLIIGLIITLKISGLATGVVMGAAALTGGAALGALKLAGTTGASAYKNRWAGKKPGEEGYEEWKKTHQHQARIETAGRWMFGGETEKEKKEWGKRGPKWVRRGVRAVASIPTLGLPYLAASVERNISAKLAERERTRINESYEKVKGKTLETQKAVFYGISPIDVKWGKIGADILKRKFPTLDSISGPQQKEDRIGALRAMAEEGRLKDAKIENNDIKEVIKDILTLHPGEMDALKFIDPKLTAEAMKEVGTLTDRAKNEAGIFVSKEDEKKYTPYTILNKDNKYAQDKFEKELEEFREKYKKENPKDSKEKIDKAVENFEERYKDQDTVLLTAKLRAEVKPEKIEKVMTKSAYLEALESEVAAKFWKGEHLSVGAKKFAGAFFEKFAELRKDNPWKKEWLTAKGPDGRPNNEAMHQYFGSSAARNLGIGYSEEEMKQERKKEREERKKEKEEEMEEEERKKKEKEEKERDKRWKDWENI